MADDTHREVTVIRRATGQYRATNPRGASIEFGSGRDDQFTPVELLLAALGGCASVGVDVVTSRRSEPSEFTVSVGGEKLTDENGATKVEDITVDFRIRFADDEKGRTAAGLVDTLLRRAHDKDCTVSRTIENPTSVTFTHDGKPLT